MIAPRSARGARPGGRRQRSGAGSTARTSPRWWCPQADELHIRQWDDDAAVVFDDSTGHTHLVDALAAQVLRSLQHGEAVSTPQLAAAVTDAVHPDHRAALASALHGSVGALQSLGLLRCCDE